MQMPTVHDCSAFLIDYFVVGLDFRPRCRRCDFAQGAASIFMSTACCHATCSNFLDAGRWLLVNVLRSLVVCCLGRSGWTPTSDRQVSTLFVVSDLPMALGRCLLFYATGMSAVLRIRDAELCFAVLRDRRCCSSTQPDDDVPVLPFFVPNDAGRCC